MSGQEQQALSHCKCLLEMGQPGLVTAAALTAARAPLPGSELAGSLVEWEKQSPVEPPSVRLALAAQAGSICAPYLGNISYTSKARINQSHYHDPLPGTTSITGIEEACKNDCSSLSRTCKSKPQQFFITHGPAKWRCQPHTFQHITFVFWATFRANVTFPAEEKRRRV